VSSRTRLLIGTKKGAFFLDSDAERRNWQLSGPFCETWPIHHVIRTDDGTLHAAGGDAWYGPAVFRSDDDGATWLPHSEGLTYGDDQDKITTVWSVHSANGTLFAGVEPAGLFRSDDGGLTWQHVAGLREHPSRPEWQPGAGGLCLHSIVTHPTDERHMWVGISAVGPCEKTDRGEDRHKRNKAVRADFYPGPPPEFGQCVHKLGMHPARPAVLYQQNHCGVYRTDDGGSEWIDVTPGLPSQFGFPLAIHPHDPKTIFVIPLNGDDQGRHMIDGQAAVYRSRDEGGTWQRLTDGLPQQGAYLGVLRESMTTDNHDVPGIYFGTSTGQVFGSTDEGDTWTLLADFLPSIWSVEATSLAD
jgi:photosystem II stability/assembly factor-like uncharacterized protein